MRRWLFLCVAIAVGAICWRGKEPADSAALFAAVESLTGCTPQQVEKGRRKADSKDVVFLVRDSHSVVKAFTDSHRFSNCRAALERFKSLDLVRSTHPQLLATASCRADGKRYSLLHMTFLDGVPLTELVYDSRLGPIAARRLGEALAELHGHVQEFSVAVPLSHQDDLTLKIRWLPDEHQSLVAQSIASVSAVVVSAVPLHGDATLKNILYDELTDSLAFVDLGSSSAFGCAEQDYTQVEQALLSLDPTRLEIGKREALLQAFREGYSRPLHPAIYAFYQLRRACDRLRDYELRKGRWKTTEEQVFFTARRAAALKEIERLAGRLKDEARTQGT